ncbi:MBL fold metallo-hydrolase [Streptomyces diastatochromogenes]|nr:MBL fold metallo-hydrolase [Streptomyces diastatochromogenes]
MSPQTGAAQPVGRRPASPPSLPSWAIWWQRPFPDAHTLLLPGKRPALVDSGFVGHARQTADRARAVAGRIDLVVNTHWHSDHVGGNALLQAAGAGIAAGAPEAEALARRDPGCCAAEYLDQPVAPYTVDVPLDDGQVLRLGDADWEVVRTPGHTPGHLALWQPEERLLVVGDALSDYDVGWVNLALDGPGAATTALASLQRMADLRPRVVLPSTARSRPTRGRLRRRPAPRPTARRRPRRGRLVRHPPDLRLRPHDPRRHPVRGGRTVPPRARVADRRRAPPAADARGARHRTGDVHARRRGVVRRHGRLRAAAEHTPWRPSRCACPTRARGGRGAR